jgi:large subunit ribosomal protein L13
MEHTIDAKNKIVGRLASEVATLLAGKTSPAYKPNVVLPMKVSVYNTDKIRITGKKPLQKIYRRHSGRIGNLKEESFEKLLKRDSRQILKIAIMGMLPKNRLRSQRIKQVTFYKGPKES